MKRRNMRVAVVAGLAGVATAVAGLIGAGPSEAASSSISFKLVRSQASVNAGAHCLANAKAKVTIVKSGQVETMTIDAWGLPHRKGFDVFITQIANAPFGVSWYQGDLDSNKHGRAHGVYKGRFNIESFAVAPGSTAAPQTDDKDAAKNPAFKPIHTYHVGIWWNSPSAAAAAHCNGAVTPFNGDHHAGVQALSSRQFKATAGPLSKLS